MPDPYPPPTWTDGMTPTVDQLKAWIRTFDPARHDARVAADMIAGQLADEQRAHWATKARLEAVAREKLLERDRYRLAWLSACRSRRALRRMVRARDDMLREADQVLETCLENGGTV